MIDCAFLTNSIPRNIDPKEILLYFNGWGFALAALLYSAAVFGNEFFRGESRIFSPRNARKKSQTWLCHAATLIWLYLLLEAVRDLAPRLPYWLTDNFRTIRGGSHSGLDILVGVLVVAMAYFERKWLFKER